MRLLIVSGGTGGHIYPARAFYEYVKDKADVTYLEKKIISSPRNIWKIICGFFQSLKYLLRFKPNAVFVTGGYGVLPMGLACFLMHKKLFLQEQNVFLGKTNKILAFFAKKVFWQTPVRNSILKVRENDFKKRHTILIFGGSQGAKSINDVIRKIDWTKFKKVVHIVGKNNIQTIKNDNYSAFDYYENMAELYQETCLAVCRSGGSTLAELSVCGIPAILIPYPYAAQNHQMANALQYSNKGCAVICKDQDLFKLEAIIKELYFDRDRLLKMSEQMKELSKKNACEEIWKQLKKIA